jgi:hypothetical protein
VQDQPTTLWKAQREGDEVACRARLVPYGIEVDLVRNDKVVLTRVFETDQEALAWAQAKRAARESEGWTPIAPETPDTSLPVA